MFYEGDYVRTQGLGRGRVVRGGGSPLVEVICGGVEIPVDELELSCREEYEECALRIWLMEEWAAIRCHQQAALGPLPIERPVPDLEEAMRKSVLRIHTEDAPKPEEIFVGFIGDERNRDAAARGERRVQEGAPVIKVEVTRVEEAYAA
jgi:hypothetical protein